MATEVCELCNEVLDCCPCLRCMSCEELFVDTAEFDFDTDGEIICSHCKGGE
jgi:hypothetical protein